MKRIKTLLTIGVLAIMPVAGWAECPMRADHASVSCAEGSVWDSAAKACVVLSS